MHGYPTNILLGASSCSLHLHLSRQVSAFASLSVLTSRSSSAPSVTDTASESTRDAVLSAQPTPSSPVRHVPPPGLVISVKFQHARLGRMHGSPLRPPAGRYALSCLCPLSATCCPRPCPWHPLSDRGPSEPCATSSCVHQRRLSMRAMHGHRTGVGEIWSVPLPRSGSPRRLWQFLTVMPPASQLGL
ncbi:hypothetical protein BV20DRAFT_660955 [Pilatotrama ljubarskyi]|nr:hypothetical protein BV20DRAFT_660955 [Pilatotrama ljubarskyi]